MVRDGWLPHDSALANNVQGSVVGDFQENFCCLIRRKGTFVMVLLTFSFFRTSLDLSLLQPACTLKGSRMVNLRAYEGLRGEM